MEKPCNCGMCVMLAPGSEPAWIITNRRTGEKIFFKGSKIEARKIARDTFTHWQIAAA